VSDKRVKSCIELEGLISVMFPTIGRPGGPGIGTVFAIVRS
jgi:hypothetical protein